MNMYWLYSNLIKIAFYLTYCLGEYLTSKQATNWTIASKQCKIATPKNFLCHHHQNICLNINRAITIDSNDGLWVGFYSIEMSLKNVDCVRASYIPDIKENNKDATICLKKCLTSKFIGISKRYCICRNSSFVTSIGSSKCNQKDCRWPKGLKCGGKDHSAEFLSVYMNDGHGNDREADGNLENTTDDKSKNAADDNSDSANEDDRLRREVQPNNGFIKVPIIFKYGATEGHSYDKKYGYVQHDVRSYFLLFSSNNVQKKALCEMESTDKIVTSSTMATDHTTEDDGMKTKQSEDLIATESNVSNPKDSIDPIVAVLVFLSLLVVIVVVAGTVLFVYRRYRYLNRFNKMTDTDEQVATHEYNYPNFTYHVSSNEAKHSDLNQIEYNYPDFSILTESDPCKYEIGNDSELSAQGNESHLYSKTDNEYNTTSARPNIIQNKTYDHAVTATKSSSSASCDITYDVSMSTNTQLQRRRFGELTENVYNTDNGIYNQLHGGQSEIKTSENYMEISK